VTVPLTDAAPALDAGLDPCRAAWPDGAAGAGAGQSGGVPGRGARGVRADRA
jgi:hypothetical protein